MLETAGLPAGTSKKRGAPPEAPTPNGEGKRRRPLPPAGGWGFSTVSLAEARELARANRELARDGGDPRAGGRQHSAGVPTLEEAAHKVLGIHKGYPEGAPGAGGALGRRRAVGRERLLMREMSTAESLRP